MNTTTMLSAAESLDVANASTVKVTIRGRSAPIAVRRGLKNEKPESHHLSVDRKATEDPVRHQYSVVVPLVPLSYSLANQRMVFGLRTLIGSILGIGIGTYLATEVSTTPPLHAKVALVAAICGLLGVCLIPMSIRDLFGKFRVDSKGIRLTPRLTGFSIPWDELDQWAMEGPAFRFHCRRTDVTHILPADYLTASGRQQLIDLLRACAPGKDRTKV